MLSRLTLKGWPVILLITLFLGGISIPSMVSLYKRLSTDPLDLLSPKHPNVQTLLKVRDEVIKRSRIGIVLESSHSNKTVEYMTDLANRLRKESFVYLVDERKVGYDSFDKHKVLFMDLEDLKTLRDRIDRKIQREKLGGFLLDLGDEENELNVSDINEKYSGEYSESTRNEYYTNAKNSIYTVYVESQDTDTGIKATSQFYDRMAQFLEDEEPEKFEPTLKTYLVGPTKVLEYRSLIHDLKLAGLISGICLFIPLLIRFRSPLAVLLIFAPLTLGIPIGFAVGSLFIDKLNVITSFLFAILGGLGIESGIHIYSRYHSSRRTGRSVESAIAEIYSTLGRPILTAVASVAVTFLLLAVNDFRGFSEFGILAGIGLWVLFLLYFSFFPSLLIFMEKIKLLRFKTRETPEPTIPMVSQKWIRFGLIFFAMFSVYSLVSPFFIGFEYDSKKIRSNIPEFLVAKKKQRETSTRVNSPAVIVIESRAEAAALKKAFEERKEKNPETTIDTARSYYDLVPEDQNEKMKVVREMKRMLADPTIKLVEEGNKKDLNRFKKALKETKTFSDKDVPTRVKEAMLGKLKLPRTLFFINAKPDLELDDGRNAMQFADEVGKIKTATKTYYPSSDASIFGIVLKTMFKDTPRVLLLSLLSVTLFVFLDFRSFKETTLVVVSIVMGVFWLFGLMTLTGLKINFYNLVIIPAVMGMSIDNAIHVMHRYQELGKGSLKKVLSSTGLACLMASVTNAAGFAGLLFTVHKGLYSMGLLAILGVGTCLLSTLLFLPALIKLLETKEARRAA